MWENMFVESSEIDVVGKSGTLDEAIEMIKAQKPDIVLLDINLAQDSGLDAIPLIRKFSPGTKIIGVSMHDQPSYAKKMLRLGAKGYVTKNSSYEEVITAIEEVMKGGMYLCKEITDIIADQVIHKEPVEHDTKILSLREMEIVKFIKDGLSSKEISSLINIRLRTVEVHRQNILRKLNFKNTASLVNFINNSHVNFL